MSYFDQYNQIAASAANQYGVDQSIFFGLIQQESSWNPFAQASGSSAYGFTQLTKGAAADVGVNRFNPVQNIYGGAAYLKQQLNRFGGDYTKALAAYNQGAGNWQAGLGYAKSVLDKAKQFMNSGTITDAARALAGDPTAIFSLGSNLLGGGGDSCGINPICYLRQWLAQSSFMVRLALAVLAFLFILGGLYLMKGD